MFCFFRQFLVCNQIEARSCSRNTFLLADPTACSVFFTLCYSFRRFFQHVVSIIRHEHVLVYHREGNRRGREGAGRAIEHAPLRSQRMLSSVCTPVLTPRSPRTGCLARRLLDFLEHRRHFLIRDFSRKSSDRVRWSTKRTSREAPYLRDASGQYPSSSDLKRGSRRHG